MATSMLKRAGVMPKGRSQLRTMRVVPRKNILPPKMILVMGGAVEHVAFHTHLYKF